MGLAQPSIPHPPAPLGSEAGEAGIKGEKSGRIRVSELT